MKPLKGTPETPTCMKFNTKRSSPVLLLIAAVIWGFAFSAQKLADELPPFTIGAIRYLLGTLFLIPMIPVFDSITGNGRRFFSRRGLDFTRREWIGGAICGLALALATTTQQYGISGTTAGATSFVTALYVIFVPIFSLVLGKKTPYNVWVGMGIALVGSYLLCVKGDFSVGLFDLIVLCSAMLFAVQIIAVGHYTQDCDGVRLSCLQFFFTFLFCTVGALIFDRPWNFPLIGQNVLPLLFLGFGSSGIGFTFQTLGQKHTAPALASLIMSLEAVFGAIGAALFLAERLSAREYLGCAIVLLGVFLAQFDPLRFLRAPSRKAKDLPPTLEETSSGTAGEPVPDLSDHEDPSAPAAQDSAGS